MKKINLTEDTIPAKSKPKLIDMKTAWVTSKQESSLEVA